MPQAADQHGESRTGELQLQVFLRTVMFLTRFCLQSDTLLSLLGVGGLLDFDSERSYR